MTWSERVIQYTDKGGTHAQGLALLKENIPNSPWLRILATEDRINAGKLHKLLLAAQQQHVTEPTAAVTSQQEATASSWRSRVSLRYTPERLALALPPELQTLDAAWRRRYKAAVSAHYELTRSRSDKRRKVLAFEILNHFDYIREAWEQVDYFREHGVVKPAEKVNTRHWRSMTLNQIMRHRMNIAPNVVKNRGKLKGATKPEEIRVLTERIAGYQQQILEIEEYFNHAQTILQAAGSAPA